MLWKVNPNNLLNWCLNQAIWKWLKNCNWFRWMNQTWPHYLHFCYRGLDANKILDQQKNTKYVVNVWYIAQPSAEATEVKATFWFSLLIKILLLIYLTLDIIKRMNIAWNMFLISTLEPTWYDDRSLVCVFWGKLLCWL